MGQRLDQIDNASEEAWKDIIKMEWIVLGNL
jgi:hypothetical protein